ncbi:amidohydrolase family protein [Asticcacaulis benevestitus]|uniref:Amidohydrolase-related domain-containing protein n=1 Tax=Asticcacaulis benevestitus DSM 16100 = ATCC BAA-896 TaxID=1121022 RepID=V4PTY9_9CAUL|nr:amidohydrolase family protein [Asticcacaulis benevestitus]ESQ91821.1 hypothetical protein ABENE_09315 [Asticcacaulis benevestitus DSM 16100 = ATCC BAA-896]
MIRIDSHLHVWDPHMRPYAWLNQVPALNRRFGPEDLSLKLDYVIFVQADCHPDQALDEADWVAAMAADAGIIGIVAYAPLERGRTVLAHLEQLAVRPLVKGVRRNLQDVPADFIESAAHFDGMVCVAQAGLSIDLCVRAHQLPLVLPLLERLFTACPDAHVILDHLGKPAIGGEATPGRHAWSTNLARLAAFPNLYAKLSGLLTETVDYAWSTDLVSPYLKLAIDELSPDRCMFGSDWPVINLAGRMEDWIGIVESATSGLPEAAARAIWCDTACRAYRLSLPG